MQWEWNGINESLRFLLATLLSFWDSLVLSDRPDCALEVLLLLLTVEMHKTWNPDVRMKDESVLYIQVKPFGFMGFGLSALFGNTRGLSLIQLKCYYFDPQTWSKYVTLFTLK
jgi:hypothetical protein